MRTAVYSGSFDPFTVGHLDMVCRAAELFDVLYVGVLNNSAKRCAFSLDERKRMAEAAITDEGLTNVRVEAFSGLLVDFMREKGASFIVRGLRGPSDFAYEAPMDAANRHLLAGAETVYLASKPTLAFISSSVVREIASLGGDIDGLVPEKIKNLIAERLTSDEQ